MSIRPLASRCARRAGTFVGVVYALIPMLVLGVGSAAAQRCGDADQSGTITVTDGVLGRCRRRLGSMIGCMPCGGLRSRR